MYRKRLINGLCIARKAMGVSNKKSSFCNELQNGLLYTIIIIDPAYIINISRKGFMLLMAFYWPWLQNSTFTLIEAK